MGGDRARLRAILDGDIGERLARSPHSFQLALSDIVDADLRVWRWPRRWRCVIATPDRWIRLRNGRARGSFITLSRLLGPPLGDRLRVRGFQPLPAQRETQNRD